MAGVTEKSIRQSNMLRGKAWNIYFDAIDPTGADDHFLYIKNSAKRPLEVTKMELFSTVAGFVEPFRASGDPANTPATNTPANLRGDGSKPVATVNTGVDLALTVGEKLGGHYLAANTPRVIDLEHGIVIQPGTAVAFNWDQATGVLTGMVTLHEVPAEDDPSG